jgi:cysteine desulfurase / selenocysteine lyase
MTNNNVRESFPILTNNLIYLDSAATTQKPLEVISSITNHYNTSNSNIHRGLYSIAQKADKAWLDAHSTVAQYINAKTYKEVVFTKNCTESLNLVANSIPLEKGDVVVTTILEHHSNILPWKKVCKQKEAILEIIPITSYGTIDMEKYREVVKKYRSRVKVVTVAHQSNVLGTVNPVAEIVKMAKTVGAITVVDGAQSIAHMKVDVQELNCDIYTFSSHKIYGPSGVGILYCKEEILETLQPWIEGGEMVKSVKEDEIIYNDLPWRFEAGTPAIEGGVGLAVALNWFGKKVEELGGWGEYQKKELDLTKYTVDSLMDIKGMEILGGSDIERVGVISFNISGLHPHDIATLLGEKDICVRAGYHCAQPLHNSLNSSGSVRVSLGIYNEKEDIDILVTELKNIVVMFK